MKSTLAVTVALVVPAVSENPVDKVIGLLEELKTQIEEDGKTEADQYGTFAEFCKGTTTDKSEAITGGQDTIDELSASMGEETATKAAKKSQLSERQKKHEGLQGELKGEHVRCMKQDAEFGAKEADLTKAVSSLDKAIKALSAKKPSLATIRDTVGQSLGLAEALSLIGDSKMVTMKKELEFVQVGVDPSAPGFKFHSQGIIDTIQQLLDDFTTEKDASQKAWDESKAACGTSKSALTDELDLNNAAMDELKADIDRLTKSIATSRENVVEAQGLLQDDHEYLKELTGTCEKRAQTFDQRAQMRNDEIEALSKALTIIGDKVKDADSVNREALLLQQKKKEVAPSLLQKISITNHRNLLSAVATVASGKDKARDILSLAGDRLKSPALSALAQRVLYDPFGKVKSMIQGLIQDLLDEAKQEADKKGFCDQELGKAMKTRDFRFAEIEKVSADLSSLEANLDGLTDEIKELKEGINTTTKELEEATDDRKANKKVNLETLETARGGLEAVTEAIAILKTFYKQAQKAKPDKWALVQGVNDDAPEVASENYAGNQKKAGGIVGLLETIKEDFERTITNTETDEKNAAADYVDFHRTSTSNIASKETGKKLNEQDLESTKNSIESKTEDILAAQKLLDGALKAMEDLKPMCIDNSMSFEERGKKRDEEIAALKTALCYLDPEKGEGDCGKE